MNKTIIFLMLGMAFSSCSKKETTDINFQKQNNNIKKKENVLVQEIDLQDVEQTIELSGVIEPIQDTWIFAQISGYVIKLDKTLGNKVFKDEEIGLIDDNILQSQFLQAKASVQAAEASLKSAQLNFTATNALFIDQTVSQIEYEQAEIAIKSAQAQLDGALAQEKQIQELIDNAYLKAPFAGTIAEINIREGDFISQGTPLFRVVNDNKYRVKTTVGLIDKKVIDKNKNALIKNSNEKLKVIGIGNAPHANTSNFSIEFQMDKSSRFSVGETIFINVPGKILRNKIMIPDNAISKEYEQFYVFLVQDDKAQRVNIEIDNYVGSNAIIGKGLTEGDKVIIDGVENIKTGSFITIKN